MEAFADLIESAPFSAYNLLEQGVENLFGWCIILIGHAMMGVLVWSAPHGTSFRNTNRSRIPAYRYKGSPFVDSVFENRERGEGAVGYTEGCNVAIKCRFADGRHYRLSSQLTDLIGVIVFAGLVAPEELLQRVRASSIPIVFNTGLDPARLGLVASMNRPRGKPPQPVVLQFVKAVLAISPIARAGRG